VLVPISLSASTAEVLKYAALFGKRFEAVVQFLHVVQLNIAGEERGAPRLRLIRQLADDARLQLQKLIEMFWDADVMSVILIREGRPHEVIVREARDGNSGVIIMGARKRPWLSRLVRPKTLERVIRNAPCPVLTVHASDRVGSFFSPSLSRQPLLTPAFRRFLQTAKI